MLILKTLIFEILGRKFLLFGCPVIHMDTIRNGILFTDTSIMIMQQRLFSNMKDIFYDNRHYLMVSSMICSTFSGVAQKRDHKGRPLSPRSKEELRLKVNQRERQRMHDLNMALDALRQVCTCIKETYYLTQLGFLMNKTLSEKSTNFRVMLLR